MNNRGIAMNERHQKILDILTVKKSSSIEYLCKQLAYSRSTIRRDVVALEELGVVRREKGQVALRVGRTKEKIFKLRNLENTESKKVICQGTKDFITDGMSLFLDGSSTVLQIVPYLREYDNITVVTNGIELAYELIHMPNIELFVVGGYVREGTSAIVGENALDYIDQFNLDLCIFGCTGIDKDGVYEPSMQQAFTKKKMIEKAEQSILLVDSSKFNKKYKFTLARYTDIDYIITNELPPLELIDQVKEYGCEMIKAE